MNVLDFCLKIENAIPDEICDDLIRIFDESEQKSRMDRNGYPNWTNLFISELVHDEKELIQNKIEEQNWHILRAYQEYLGEYGKYFVSDKNCFKFEQANIKCYVGGTDDRYDLHADVSTLLTSKRYLGMIWYLNDDFTGGKTTFFPDCSLQPKKGSVLVFPPYWMFPHSGEPVIEGKKYIMSTYCEWSDGQD